MKPQKQAFRHSPNEGTWGDCHRTAIAMILNMERDDVPHFMDNMDPELLSRDNSFECKESNRRVEDFLHLHGLAEFMVPLEGHMKVEDVVATAANWGKKVPVILGGKSSTGVLHSIVLFQGEIYNPNWCDLVAPCNDGYWWITILATGPNWRMRE